MSDRNAAGNSVLVVGPILIVTFFLLAASGQHPESLLSSPSTVPMLEGIGVVIAVSAFIAYMSGRLLARKFDWAICLAALCFLLSLAGLFAATRYPSRFRGPSGDALSVLVIYGMAAQLVAGIVLAVRSGRFWWLGLSLLAVGQFVYGFMLVIAQAMVHWH